MDTKKPTDTGEPTMGTEGKEKDSREQDKIKEGEEKKPQYSGSNS